MKQSRGGDSDDEHQIILLRTERSSARDSCAQLQYKNPMKNLFRFSGQLSRKADNHAMNKSIGGGFISLFKSSMGKNDLHIHFFNHWFQKQFNLFTLSNAVCRNKCNIWSFSNRASALIGFFMSISEYFVDRKNICYCFRLYHEFLL